MHFAWAIHRAGRIEPQRRLLYRLKQPRGGFGLVTFGRAVDDPDFVATLPQVPPHALEPRAAQKAGHSDVGHDAARPAPSTNRR